jgi:hypothetical protein
MKQLFLLLIVLGSWPQDSCSAEIRLGKSSTVVFATVAEGKKILEKEDAFTRALGPFDRAARAKSDKQVSPKEFLAFAARSVLPWPDAEKRKVETAFRGLEAWLSDWSLPFPKKVFLVKTSGKEEGGAAYTRGEAIILPVQQLAIGDEALRRLICHELFHVLSRANPEVRDRLYAAIGFVRCGELEFPESEKARKLTNPDAPQNEHAIQVEVDGAKVWTIPVLLSRSETYDKARGGEFFDYLQFKLLAVELREGEAPRPILDGTLPRYHDAGRVKGYLERAGRNTHYIIHPEEILADNFVLLVSGKAKLPSPQVLEAIGRVLKEPAAKAGPAAKKKETTTKEPAGPKKPPARKEPGVPAESKP